MMTYAADFWPLFWTIIGAGAVLTALVSLLIATFPAPAGSHHAHRLFVIPPGRPAGPHEHAEQPPRAA